MDTRWRQDLTQGNAHMRSESSTVSGGMNCLDLDRGPELTLGEVLRYGGTAEAAD